MPVTTVGFVILQNTLTGEVSRDNRSVAFHIYKRTHHCRGEHACGSRLTVLHLTLGVAAGTSLSDKFPGGLNCMTR